jgi:molybdopterin synthase sulfur carrier subunit
MKIMYFAWMREHIGAAHETRKIPKDITTVSSLVDHLRCVSGGHAKALSNMDVVRVAVNQHYADLNTAINDSDEVAFFPPVTGG